MPIYAYSLYPYLENISRDSSPSWVLFSSLILSRDSSTTNACRGAHSISYRATCDIVINTLEHWKKAWCRAEINAISEWTSAGARISS